MKKSQDEDTMTLDYKIDAVRKTTDLRSSKIFKAD